MVEKAGSGMQRTETIGLRVTQDVKTAAAEAAADDNRSVASLVEKVLIDHLVSSDYLEPKQVPAGRRRLYKQVIAARDAGAPQPNLAEDCD